MTAAPQPESRRARHRRELVAEILDIARRQLEAGGRAGVSLRAIAREVGMNPASLYTYFAGLDDLFTALLLQNFESLAAAVEAARGNSEGEPAAERVLACTGAYRRWATAHPAQFNLLFADAIPGYRAPAEGGTLQAELAIWAPILTSIGELVGADLTPDAAVDRDPGDLTLQVFGFYGMMHGLVLLEINHHLPPELDLDLVFDSQMRRALEAINQAAP